MVGGGLFSAKAGGPMAVVASLLAHAVYGSLLGYGYWIIFAGSLLDNAWFPLPGELLLLSFGVLARTGHVSLELSILLASAAAVSGDNIGYWLGRRRGQRLPRAYCRLTLGSGKCVAKAVAFYPLRGSVAVVFGRFVMGLRASLASDREPQPGAPVEQSVSPSPTRR